MNKKETMLYVNLREGLNSRPNLIPMTEKIEKLIKNPSKDYYVSLFKYTEDHKKVFEEKGTLSGIRDTVTDKLYFDFDSKSDLNLARNDAITAAERLVESGVPEEAIGCYFTGSKGFNLEVNLDRNITPEEFKSIVFGVAGDLKTFDRVVNDPNRIIRIPNTKHQSSGLFKIELEPSELVELEIEQIKNLAKTKRLIQRTKTKTSVTEKLMEMMKTTQKEKTITQIQQELTFDISSIDLKQRPKGMDESRWLLANGFFRHGERNNSMLCLAATYKNFHYPEELTKNLLMGVAEIQSKRTGEEIFPEKEIDLIIGQVYGPNWKGGMFTTRDPNNWLAQYARKMGLNIEESEETPKTIVSIAPAFVKFIQEIDKNTIKTGIDTLDKIIPMTVGSNIGIVAGPGVGKTALALKILKHNSKQGIVSVFASLDMSRNRLFEKVVYNVTGMNRNEMYRVFCEGKHEEILKKVKEEYGNVWFYDKTAASVSDIKEFVKNVEQTTGEKVKLLMIDYFERVNSNISDDTAASKKVANEIQDAIIDLDVLAITLYQPNKMSLGSGPDTEIKSYTAIKGSSFIYQACRGIIGLSRPFYTPKTKELDRFMIMNILKNDLGELDRLELGWNGKTGEIFELEDHEKEELRDLMALKEGNGDDDGEWS
jgi:hypothetical protein